MQETTQKEYAAVRGSVGFLDLSYRGKLEATGPDRITFLHSMISNDVQGLANFTGRYATLLTPTGKIVSDFYYYVFPEFVLIDIEPGLVPKTMEMLEKYIIMDEVDFKDISDDIAHLSLHGPRSPELIRQLFCLPGPSAQYQVQETEWEGARTWLIRKSELEEDGYEILLSEKAAPSLREAVMEAASGELKLLRVGQEARNILRVENGVPWYGVDMDESHYPMEARLDNAISLTKGCYLGQEVVARATNLGGVPKLLIGLKLRSDFAAPRKARVLDKEGKPMGSVTSSVFSLRLQTPIALAYLKRAFAAPGTLCQVEISPEKLVSAEVVDRFV